MAREMRSKNIVHNIERSVDSGVYHDDLNLACLLTTTTGTDIQEIELENKGYKFLHNVTEDNIIVWASYAEPRTATDFRKMAITPGYNWESPIYISLTEPAGTKDNWTNLSRVAVDSVQLVY